jgi:nucleoside 2-deoxyribosyltransferase
MMVRVYFASKLRHGGRWRTLCASAHQFVAYARWLKHTSIGTPDTPDNASTFWLEDQQDVKHADVVVVYAEPGEHLRGALVEAGMAIAYGKPVVVVGDHPDYGTWQYHPLVHRVADFDEMLSFLSQYSRYGSPVAPYGAR